jgi:hypothetical protein
MSTDRPADFKEGGPTRKPYESPRLEVYGDIREITEVATSTGVKSDGGLHGNSKT